MYEIEVHFECGKYVCMALTPLSVPMMINRILNKARQYHCEHLMTEVKVTLTDKDYYISIMYYGACAFGV